MLLLNRSYNSKSSHSKTVIHPLQTEKCLNESINMEYFSTCRFSLKAKILTSTPRNENSRGGGGGGSKTKVQCVGGMNIFWKYTFCENISTNCVNHSCHKEKP